ncbi:unnamed protein product [Haemonchus placei]|uniref:Uncharacterized protein n=1 Tax=Haemonchus placei TaxID=6290 RepID=A0A0N4WSB3_HAEPC|nr:unnamed protein product [Haemonchus placei]
MSSVSPTSDSALASKYCDSPSSNGSAYSSILDRLGKEESLPSYAKFIIGVLIETKEEISELNRRCNAILLENKVLKEENDSLKSQLGKLLSSFKVIDSKADRSGLSLPPDADRKPLEIDYDLKRSIVVADVPESQRPGAVDRARHDLQCVSTLLNYLDVEYFPSLVYRMGEESSSQPRLLKVVLPTARSQREAVRKAPRLRFLPHGKVYIRSFLTREERMRRREARKVGSVCLNDSMAHQTQRIDSTDRCCNVDTETALESTPQGNL